MKEGELGNVGPEESGRGMGVYSYGRNLSQNLVQSLLENIDRGRRKDGRSKLVLMLNGFQ